MCSIQDQEVLNKNNRRIICWGVGGKRGKEYRCGAKVDDPEIISEVEELIGRAKKRIEDHVLDGSWIMTYENELKDLEKSIEIILKGKYNDSIIYTIKGVIERIKNYVSKDLARFWNRVRDEIIEIIRHGEVMVRKTRTGMTIVIMGDHVRLTVQRINSSIIIRISFRRIRSVKIHVQDIWSTDMTPEQLGFEASDMGMAGNKLMMSTTHLWQLILGLLLFHGDSSIKASALSVKSNKTKIVWRMRSLSYNWRDALRIAKNLTNEGIVRYLLSFILGDGYVSSKHREIRLITAKSDIKTWEEILEKLNYDSSEKIIWSIDDKTSLSNAVRVRFNSTNAILLSKMILNKTPPMMADLLTILNVEKWNEVVKMANMSVNRRVRQVRFHGISFSVFIKKGKVLLVKRYSDPQRIKNVINVLKSILNEKAMRIQKWGNTYALVILVSESEIVSNNAVFQELKPQILSIICKRYEKSRNKKELIKAISSIAPIEINSCGHNNSGKL